MKLDEYLDEFEDLDAEERLEVLMDFGHELPPLGPEHQTLQNRSDCQIQECQTPVYMHVGLEQGTVHLAAHVPEKSPTVRGFVAMLVNGLAGTPAERVLQIPDNMPERLGLRDVLGMTRFRGFTGIVAFIKREIRRLQAAAAVDPPPGS